MARPTRALLLAAGLAAIRAESAEPAADAAAEDLRRRLAELREGLHEGGGRLEGLERRLSSVPGSTVPGASLFPIAAAGTRAYTPTEKFDGALRSMWLLVFGIFAMFLNGGMAMLKAGSCRVKSVQHVMLLSLWDMVMGTMAWWILGWSFAFSGPFDSHGGGRAYKSTSFMGYEEFAGHAFIKGVDKQQDPTFKMAMWFISWAFTTVAASIVSGGVAERNFIGYSVHCFFSTCFIIPIAVAWTWGGGFLLDMNVPGYQDMAGGGVIHMTAGFSALVGAILAGPRPGRFSDLTKKERWQTIPDHFTPHSQPLVVLGTFITWFGTYGVHCGLIGWNRNIRAESGMLAAQVAMNTTLAAAASGLMAYIVQWGLKRKNDLDGLCFGVIAGLVAISAGCASVECGTAVGIGCAAGVIYPLVSAALKMCGIDDPIDAFAVHGACGLWGVFAAALMDWGEGFRKVHGSWGFRCVGFGVACYDDGTSKAGGNLIGANAAAIVALAGWALVLSAIIFAIARKCLKFKGDIDEEGIDRVKHLPEKGYNFGVPNSADISLHSI